MSFRKKFFFEVDGIVPAAILLTPLEAGPRHPSGWFSPVLGLQIGTQFCPGMMNGNPPWLKQRRAGRKSSPAIKLSFFVARKRREFTPKKFGAGSLISTYRVVNTTFKS
jgi:hypothetical protein